MSSSNIYPKSCVYNCNTHQIYWNTSVNEYWEVFTKKKHICPNRTRKTTTTTTEGITPPSTASKPRYYNPSVRKRTPYASFVSQQQSKPKSLIPLNYFRVQ